MNYGFEYYIGSDREFFINLIVQICFTEDVIFFVCVHHPTFIGYVDSSQSVFH